jgi:hypothetical protein
VLDLLAACFLILMWVTGIFCVWIGPFFIFKHLKRDNQFALPVLLFFISPLILMFYAEDKVSPRGKKLLKVYLIFFGVWLFSVTASFSMGLIHPHLTKQSPLIPPRIAELAQQQREASKVVKVKMMATSTDF